MQNKNRKNSGEKRCHISYASLAFSFLGLVACFVSCLVKHSVNVRAIVLSCSSAHPSYGLLLSLVHLYTNIEPLIHIMLRIHGHASKHTLTHIHANICSLAG